MTYNWDKIKNTLIKELKPIFDDANQPNYGFSFSDGLDLFCKTLMFKTGESDLDGIEIKVIPTIDKYYHSAKDKNDAFNYLTQLSTKLDTFLQKIVFLFHNTDYIALKSQNKGMFHFVNKCGINLNNIDFRQPLSSISANSLISNFGTYLYTAYSLRNIEAHTATDYNDDEIPKLIKDSLVIYLFTTFQYYNQLLGQVGHISIPQYLEIHEIVKELTPPREYEIDLVNVIGRENDLINLKQVVENSNNKIIAVKSIGGLGKTTLLKSYIKQNRTDFNHIIWINFQNNLVYSFINNIILLENFNTSFPTSIPDFDKYKLLMNSISKLSGKTLLLIDNLQDDSFNNLSILPLSTNCQIIASTRANFTNSFIRIFEIDTLDFESAKSLFLKYYNGAVDDTLLDELFKLIGYHTLTIELLAKTLTINFTINGLAQLIDYLKTNSISNDAWQVSVQSEYDNEVINLKSHLLNAFSITPLSDIEKEILSFFSVLPILQYSGSELKKLFSIEDKQNATFIDSLNTLVNKGWLSEINNFFQIHAILQEVIKIKIQPTSNNCSPLITGLIEHLDIKKYLPISDKIKYISCAQYFLSLITEESEDIMVLNSLVAIGLRGKGDLVNALDYAQKTLDYAQRTKDKHKIYQAYSLLGVINRHLGNLEKAFDFYIKAIDLLESLPTKYVTALTVYSNFATLLEQIGEKEHLIRAKELYQYVINELTLFIKENKPERHYLIELATNLTSLGKIYTLLDDYEKSIEFQQKAYNDLEELLGTKHEIVSICANNLGLAYGSNNDFTNSLKYHKIAVSIQEEIFDESHPELGVSKSGLANAYRNTGDITKAKALFKEVLETGEKYLPPRHPALARRKANYAVVCDPKSEKEVAKKLYHEALEIDLYNYGDKHPNIGISNLNLGTLFMEEGNWKLANKHLKIAKEIFDYNSINNSFSIQTIRYLEIIKHMILNDK